MADRAARLFAKAEEWRAKATALEFTRTDAHGLRSVAYPQIAIDYFMISESLREQAWREETYAEINMMLRRDGEGADQ